MQIVKGKGIHETIRYPNIRELVLDTRKRYESRDAFIFRRKPTEAEIHKTYQDFVGDVEAIGTALHDLGFTHRNLSVIGENSYEWMVAYSAILSGVGTGVPLDRLLPEGEVISLLRRGKVAALFYHPKHHDMMLSIAKLSGVEELGVEKFICMETEALPHGLPEDERFMDFNSLLARGQELLGNGDRRFHETDIDTESVQILLFTSGTTASSKAVMLTQNNICANVSAITSTLWVEAGERAFSVLPLHHTFENTCDYFLLSRGCVICFSDGLRYLLKNIQEWHIEVMLSVPLLFETVHRKIMDGIEEAGKGKLISIAVPVTRFLRRCKLDLRRKVFSDVLEKMGGHLRLVVIGGAGIDKSIIRDFNNFGIDFLMGYGLTETAPVISTTTPECNIYGSVGRPMVDIEVAIDTDSDRRGEVGEILTRSACVMKGYYENEEATQAVLQPDGWFRTGDMGYLDKHDCIHITGRVKSMIVLPNGKKVFPEEIESLINLIPGVKESFVWGEVKDKDNIEICAKILIDRQEVGKHLPIPEKTPGDLSIHNYFSGKIKEINHQMPSFKAVRYMVYSEGEMVKTTTMKIKRQQELDAIHNLLASADITIKEASGQILETLS